MMRTPATLHFGTTLVAAWIVAACNSAPDPAYVPPPPDPGPLAVHDTDGNGEIDRAEWQRSGESVHARMDADGDGKVTRLEAKSSFAELDTNGDGVLTSDEMYVAELDTDRNAEISRPEWEARSVVDVFDGDGDAQISGAELLDRRYTAFYNSDEDDNGSLSYMEMRGGMVPVFQF